MNSLKWWQKKEQIQALRRQGLSYREILSKIPFRLSKSTVSLWCKNVELTPEQLDRLDQLKGENWYRNRLKGSKTIQRRRAEEIRNIKAKAQAEVPHLTQKELWLAGLMLYWAEGGKKQKVEFSNSEPNAVRFMMRWFQEICRVPRNKIRAYLNIHSGQDDELIKVFWSEVTQLPLSQFGKSYVKKEGTDHRKNILYHGTIKITICNKNLLHTIQGWIEGFSGKISGPLAQSVEQDTLNVKVTGSIPVRPIDLDDVNFVMDRGGEYSLRSDGRMAELANARALEALGATLGGSSPLPPMRHV